MGGHLDIEVSKPKVIELTLHRKDRAIQYGGFRKIPNVLDSDNV